MDYLIYYIPEKDETIMIYEGTGDNLVNEDFEAGYNDYINHYNYKGKLTPKDFWNKNGDWDKGSYDGGMFLFNNEKIHYNGMEDMIKHVIEYWYGMPYEYELLGYVFEN